MLATSTSPSCDQTRISALRNSSVPACSGPGTPAPITFSGKCWRSYTLSVLRGMYLPCAGLHEPSGRCTPSRPSNTQAGSGACESALPASMSAFTHSATCFQPASCHSSNGPWLVPKPQRIAKSTSRAVSAMSARCTAA